jgi:simple sugar transport system ATP-binding protein
MADDTIIRTDGLTKAFGEVRALKGVDLSLEPGEVLGLMGDNGAGKSTLVKIIAGNFPPSEGEIRLGGEPSRLLKSSAHLCGP